MSGQTFPEPVARSLARLLLRPAERRDRNRARLHLLDWLGCAAGGAREAAGRILLSSAQDNEESRAFAWGGLGNILEMDDVDKRALLHPGPVVVPAALAVGEALKADPEQLLAAIVRGYEAVIRLGRAVGPRHYALFHNTGTCGPVGAAAACASLLRLNEDRTAHALVLAASQAAGFWHTRHDADSMGKQLHTAHAARAGVGAALLAERGFTGPPSIFEGEQGFFAGLCPDGEPGAVLEDHDHWLLWDVSFKPWPACRHAHPAIDAALMLRGEGAGVDVPKIEVLTYGDALKFCDNSTPSTPSQAKFSLQHAVATALVRGTPQLSDFGAAAIADETLRAVRSKVVVTKSDKFDRAFPAHFGACVRLEEREAVVPDALGDPENPLSLDGLKGKFAMFLGHSDVSDQQLGELLHDVLVSGPDPSRLSSFLEGLRP